MFILSKVNVGYQFIGVTVYSENSKNQYLFVSCSKFKEVINCLLKEKPTENTKNNQILVYQILINVENVDTEFVAVSIL